NSRISATPPGRSTRRISASATSLRVTLRRPKAMLTQSKLAAGKGSASASHCTAGISLPSFSMRSRRAANRRARSAVPPATSSTRALARTPEAAIAKRFQARCMPHDIRSFIRSYRPATESNTPLTRRVFSSGVTCSKPKCVCSLIESMLMTAGMRGRRRRRVGIGLAAGAGGAHPLEILLPHRFLLLAELVQIVPGIDPGVVSVGELGPDRIVADRLDLGDRDFALADLQRLLAGAVSAHVGRR